MKDEEETSTTTTTTVKRQQEGSDNNGGTGSSVLLTSTSSSSRGKYKFWALAAIILLAFWSMFTGSVTLKWSAPPHLFNSLPDHVFASPILEDLDILEVEEKERLVRRNWDVYTHSTTIQLPMFWQEAFEAAYEDLTSDVPNVRNTAVSEIAKMYLRTTNLEPPRAKSSVRPLKKEVKLSSRLGKTRKRQ